MVYGDCQHVFPSLKFPLVELPHLEGALLNSTCQFLAHGQSQLLVPSLQVPVNFHQHDQFIMDAVTTLTYITAKSNMSTGANSFSKSLASAELWWLLMLWSTWWHGQGEPNLFQVTNRNGHNKDVWDLLLGAWGNKLRPKPSVISQSGEFCP